MIQPVIQKEVIIPTVVHKTIPIHEVHRNEAKHHAATALPPMSMADFRKQGGTLNGREERYDRFEGKPQIGASERDDESILSDTSKDSYTTSQDRRSPIDEGNRRGQKPLEQPTPLRKSKPAKNNPGWRSPPSSMARMEESPRASRDNASTSKPPKSSRRSPDRKSPVSSGDRFGTDSQFRKVESTLPDKLRTSQSAANRRSTVAGKERKKARDRSPGDDRKFSLG